MKLRYILLLLLAILTAAAAYYFYQQDHYRPKTDVWSFVPENALLVYETKNLPEVWEGLSEQPVGEVIASIPRIQALQQGWHRLDSAAQTGAASGNLATFLQDRPVYVSMHVSGKTSFDYLFYVPVKQAEDDGALEKLLNSFRQDDSYRYSKRNYHDVEIHEFKDTRSNKIFAYLLQDDYLVGSFAPFLVEDVIRTFDAPEPRPLFRERYPALFQLSHIDTDAGNLYVNSARLESFLNVFTKEQQETAGYALSAKLDIELNPDGLLLNGYAVPDEREHSPYLQSLLHEKPQSLDIDHLLPLRTATLEFYGFEKGSEWHAKLVRSGVLTNWADLLQAHDLAGKLPEMLGQRVALASLQTAGEESPDQLLFLHAPRQQQTSDALIQLAGSFSEQAGDSLYQEAYSNYTITQLSYPDFPATFLGPAFGGFNETFYLQIDDYVIMSNSVQALKSLVLDVEGDNTWRKSLPLYEFLEKANQEMNFGYYVNTENSWRRMVNAAEPGWRSWLEEQGPVLRQFNAMAVQLSALDDMFYANVLLQAVPQDVKALEKVKLATGFESLLEAPAISKPMPARHGQDKSPQILVQDSLFYLYVLDAREGEIIRRDSLGAKLAGEIFQPEAGRNGELDYLAVTTNALYRYKPDFSLRPGFPQMLPDEMQAQWANVIDYNGSRMYRILLASTTGDLYMYDLDGNLLEGWEPRQLDGALSTAPGHIRVRGKDCLYAFQQKGEVQLMNRRGVSYRGFPLNLEDSLLGPVHLSPGSDFKNTLFTTVTKGGELISFNMEGRITSRQQLYKPDADTRFMLVPDKQHNGFLIVRQSRHRLSLLDSKADLLFEKDYLVAARVEVQYYNFGVDKELIAITDPDEEFTYLYDGKGVLLNFEPLNSCCPLSIRYQEEEGSYQIYKSFNNRVTALKGGK